MPPLPPRRSPVPRENPVEQENVPVDATRPPELLEPSFVEAARAIHPSDGNVLLRDTVFTVRLLKVYGPQAQNSWPLARSRPMVLGRFGEDQLLPIDIDLSPDTGVSRRHARLWFEGESWWIQDLRTRNGTKLGGMDIKGKGARRLRPGVEIAISQTLLTLTLSKLQADSGAMPAPDLPVPDASQE